MRRESKATAKGNGRPMTRSELIGRVASRHPDLSAADVETAVRNILDQMAGALACGGRIEVRGFGSFSVHHRPSRRGRNPSTGEPVILAPKDVPHFKPGKRLRERVEEARRRETAAHAAVRCGTGMTRLAGSGLPSRTN